MGGFEPEWENTRKYWRGCTDLFNGAEVVNSVLVKLVNRSALCSSSGVDLNELVGVLLVAIDAGRGAIDRGRSWWYVLLVFGQGVRDGGTWTCVVKDLFQLWMI